MHTRLNTPQTWRRDFAESHPAFEPIRRVANDIRSEHWPTLEELNTLLNEHCTFALPPGIRLRAVSQSARLKARDYDLEINEHGRLPTRTENWHDLLNLLCWCRFPETRRWINQAQVKEACEAPGRDRTAKMHLLTQLDECGVAVVSDKPALLQALRDFEWTELFWRRRDALEDHLKVLIFGHGLYEQLLEPHLGTTGRALLIQAPPAQLENLDATAVDQLIVDHLSGPLSPTRPRDLSPFPILGLPGWYPQNCHEGFFQQHPEYFRPGRRRRSAS